MLTPELESKTLIQERLWEERLILALPSGHEFTHKPSLGWGDIAELPLILRNSPVELVAYRTLLDRMDRQIHLDQHDVSCATLLDMVGIGSGATLIFASGATPHRDVIFRTIDEPNATLSVDAVWRKDDRNPLRHRLLTLIREHKNDVIADAFAPSSPSTAPAPDRD